MLRFMVAAAVLSAMPAGAATAAGAVAPVQVMVLGTYHMGNPGRDVNNMKADDPTSPRRQRELASLATALARFKPTKILVEAETKGPDFKVASYAAFTPATLATSHNETVQIGYRLANMLGQTAVYGIDEQPGPGEPDYFPYDKLAAYAAAHGQSAELDALSAPVQAFLKDFEARQPTQTVAQLLAVMNNTSGIFNSMGPFYYASLKFGDGEAQPGADLNAGWYLRNAKIFAKLINVAKPGDRLLVIYGSGHGYWLRHFARETPGFALVDVVPYLKAAKP